MFAQASARVRVLSGGSYVQINRAELEDGGQYTCVANNVAGRTTRRFHLAVQGELSRTVFITHPAEVTICH